MQIYLLFQREWAAYGGGIDDVIGGLWINPSTCKPVGSTIAHEIDTVSNIRCMPI